MLTLSLLLTFLLRAELISCVILECAKLRRCWLLLSTVVTEKEKKKKKSGKRRERRRRERERVGGGGVKQGNLAAFVKVMEFPDHSLAER